MAIALTLSASPVFAGPMELSGTFAVSESGGATYSIPIAVPPGTAGMMPNLSLGYDSQRGSGIVGVGWSLNGFSAIRRCAQTVAQDGAAGRVGFDANDRFCLDGQRLMVVAGTYGTAGSEYRTEIESFKKVTAQGTAGSGPSWFEVRLPSGRVLEYGNTPDSKILATGKTSVRVWALNKITDTKGNYLTISYSNDTTDGTTNGTYYPNSIDYTGNAAAGLAPYASVQFSYVDRPTTDQVTAYIAGSSVKLVKQLSEIKTYTGGTQVLSYKLGYEPSTNPANTATGVARLTSVQMCDAANLCQPSTTFTWSNARDATFSFAPFQIWVAAPGAVATSKPAVSHSNKKTGWKKTGSAPALEAYEGDIDGDGRADALINNNGAILVSLSNGTNAFTAPVSAGFTTYSPQLMDIFGTGRNDVVSLNASSQLVRYTNNGSGGFNTTPTVLASPGVGHPVFPDLFTPVFSDLNGDGLPDMVWHNLANVFKYAINNGTTFNTPVTITLPPGMNVSAEWCTTNTNCPINYADVTTNFANLRGRGNVDLVLTFQGEQTQTCTGGQNPICTVSGDGSWQVWTLRWNGNGFDTAFKSASVVHTETGTCGGGGGTQQCPDLYPAVTTRITDVNGDGLSDLFLAYAAISGPGASFPAGQRIYVGNGSGFNAFAAGGFSSVACTTGLMFRDMYGSGRSDAICEANTALRISRPNAAATAYTTLAVLPNAAALGEWWLKDFNGDGYLDILVQRADNRYLVALSTRVGGAPSDLVTGITTGLGATTTITYDALSSNVTANGQPIYTRGPASTYPNVVEVPDDYAVTRVERSNGIGGTFASAYRYEGWQRNLNGRGTLGLAKVIATDLGTGVQTATTYRLDYPYTGLIASDVKSVGAVTLSNVTNTHTATSLGGTRFLPLLTSSVATGADLDGSLLPSVTTNYQYDAFGNPTLVTSTASDGFSKSTSSTYSNDTTRWILGLPTQSQVTQTTPP